MFRPLCKSDKDTSDIYFILIGQYKSRLKSHRLWSSKSAQGYARRCSTDTYPSEPVLQSMFQMIKLVDSSVFYIFPSAFNMSRKTFDTFWHSASVDDM